MTCVLRPIQWGLSATNDPEGSEGIGQMPPITTKTGKVETLSEKHQRLIEQYSRTAGAAKAQVARQIAETQVDLQLEGTRYEPWVKPSPYRQSWELSESQLADQIHGLRSLVANPDVEDVTRAAAERRLERFTQQAEKRSIAVD